MFQNTNEYKIRKYQSKLKTSPANEKYMLKLGQYGGLKPEEIENIRKKMNEDVPRDPTDPFIQIKNQVDTMVDTINSLRNEVTEVRRHTNEQGSNLEKQLEETTRKFNKTQQELDETNAIVTTLADNVETLKQRLAKLPTQNEIDTLKQHIGDKHTSVFQPQVPVIDTGSRPSSRPITQPSSTNQPGTNNNTNA
jgi:chromosome segregation ATPase